MKQGIYAVRDSKAGIYMNPFTATNEGTAIRSFRQIAADEQSVVHHAPADFALYNLGEYDQDSGIITPQPAPVWVVNAE